MKKIISLNLFKEYRLEHSYKNIKAIKKDDSFIFLLDDTKTLINPEKFIRENNEFKFELNIKEKNAIYLLKEKNMKLDIEVESISYRNTDNNILLEYKISSDDEKFKIEIKIEDDINE